MILTFTPNPSLDHTIMLTEPLMPDTVQRFTSTSCFPGGKGVNVAHTCFLADITTRALFPAPSDDPFITLLADTGVPHTIIPSLARIRTNITITDSAGQTTKLNDCGTFLPPDTQERAQKILVDLARNAHYVVLAGSLPHDVPYTWYVRLVHALRAAYPHIPIAVDTSDAPLHALIDAVDPRRPEYFPTVVKANAYELGSILNIDGHYLEACAAQGNNEPIASAAQELIIHGAHEILVTLGAAGALLATHEGLWVGTTPHVTVASTIGAGDSALAGYVMARAAGQTYAHSLKNALAYGAAAAALPGTILPTPHNVIPLWDHSIVTAYA